MSDTHPEARDPSPRHWELVPFPCHHGCTCQLHEQTVYGSMVAEHDAERLDNGEMAALVTAGDNVTRLLNGYRHYFDKLTAKVVRAHTRAGNAVDGLENLRRGHALSRATDRLRRVDGDFAHYSAAEREPAHWALRILTFAVLVIVVVFDAWYFQQVFSGLLQVEEGDPERWMGVLVGGVLGAGLFLAGRLLASPIRRLRIAWRQRDEEAEAERRLWAEARMRQAERDAAGEDAPSGTAGDDSAEAGGDGRGERPEPADRRRRGSRPRESRPRGRTGWRIGRWAMTLAFPVVAVGIFGYWALLRAHGQVEDGRSPLAVDFMLLLLLLALTLMALEISVYNPYREKRGSAMLGYRLVRLRESFLRWRATRAIGKADRLWRTLRSGRDQGLTIARAELGRAWSKLILPARLRHGRAGWEPPQVIRFHSPDGAIVNGEGTRHPLPPEDREPAELTAEDVEQLYQFFENIRQPTPGLGPLAEVVRSVRDLDPQPLRERKEAILARLADQALPGAGTADDADGGTDGNGDDRAADRAEARRSIAEREEEE
ncbi:hypothetical protein [Streptomonospora litoralis]|uniref:Uncharacterized protein n=1 Tax=Streptomonospora litoralis TaxID=2498135 RepID=A0A4P6Q2Z1_9ACTN|nr:hypothetical protein [Streptomonospora litoralis]QBI53611.1 hypothetical protein EKD16_09085 [Streptomonospora litoralis]